MASKSKRRREYFKDFPLMNLLTILVITRSIDEMLEDIEELQGIQSTEKSRLAIFRRFTMSAFRELANFLDAYDISTSLLRDDAFVQNYVLKSFKGASFPLTDQILLKLKELATLYHIPVNHFSDAFVKRDGSYLLQDIIMPKWRDKAPFCDWKTQYRFDRYFDSFAYSELRCIIGFAVRELRENTCQKHWSARFTELFGRSLFDEDMSYCAVCEGEKEADRVIVKPETEGKNAVVRRTYFMVAPMAPLMRAYALSDLIGKYFEKQPEKISKELEAGINKEMETMFSRCESEFGDWCAQVELTDKLMADGEIMAAVAETLDEATFPLASTLVACLENFAASNGILPVGDEEEAIYQSAVLLLQSFANVFTLFDAEKECGNVKHRSDEGWDNYFDLFEFEELGVFARYVIQHCYTVYPSLVTQRMKKVYGFKDFITGASDWRDHLKWDQYDEDDDDDPGPSNDAEDGLKF